MAFVFDYELLKESYEINLETQERNENDASDDDVEDETLPEQPEETASPQSTLFEQEESEVPFWRSSPHYLLLTNAVKIWPHGIFYDVFSKYFFACFGISASRNFGKTIQPT